MALSDADDILRQADKSGEALHIILSRVLRIFLQERMQPADPTILSEEACRQLLDAHPALLLLLETAVDLGTCNGLWQSDLLLFHEADLASFHSPYDIDRDARKAVKASVDCYKPDISDFANGRSRVLNWSPPAPTTPSDDELKAFVSELDIPRSFDDLPCLLLHDLGALIKVDAVLDRLNRIFASEHHTLLINTAGCGKTRLLFEGLTQHWGVYMPCAVDASGIGSQDLNTKLDCDILADKYFNGYPPLSEADLLTNEGVARRMFMACLLARLTLLAAFLESVSPKERDIDVTRKRWLLFQTLPSALKCGDIIFALCQQLQSATPAYIKHTIEDVLLRIRALLGRRDLAIFCVVDDCQTVDARFRSLFRDTANPLRLMAESWDSFEGVSVILAGTPFDQQPFIRSNDSRYRLFTNTGSFDSQDEQRRYIRRYLPPALADSPSGQLLADRMWTWLKGRYRITTSFLSCLLMTTYQKPHTLLNDYISAQAMVAARDTPRGIAEGSSSYEAPSLVRSFFSFTLRDVVHDPQAWLTAQYVTHRILLGDDVVRLTRNCLTAADWGVALLTDDRGTEARAYEPLVLCPLAREIVSQAGIFNGFYPIELANTLHEPPHNDSSALVFASTLAHALSAKHRLSDIFTFPGGTAPAWAKQRASLGLVKRPRGARPKVSEWHASFAASKRERWIASSPKWLQQRSNEPFCEASQFSGADLLFVVKLEDGHCLYVALATLFHNSHVDASPAAVAEKLSALAPDNLFCQSTDGNVRERLSLRYLPKKAPGLGNPPLLRIINTFPYALDNAQVEADEHEQPVASVNMTTLRDVVETISKDDVLNRVSDVLTGRRAPVDEGDDEGAGTEGAGTDAAEELAVKFSQKLNLGSVGEL